MSTRYEANLDERDALLALRALRDESDLELVSFGERAVDLQLPDAPSPHAVNLEASFDGARLLLIFHMGDAEVARRRDWLVQRMRAHGVVLELRSIA